MSIKDLIEKGIVPTPIAWYNFTTDEGNQKSINLFRTHVAPNKDGFFVGEPEEIIVWREVLTETQIQAMHRARLKDET